MFIKYCKSLNKKYQRIRWIKDGLYLENQNNFFNWYKKEIKIFKRKKLCFQTK